MEQNTDQPIVLQQQVSDTAIEVEPVSHKKDTTNSWQWLYKTNNSPPLGYNSNLLE